MANQQESPCRILVMASGFGSNFQKLIEGVANGQIPNSQIIRLIVNRGKAYAVTRAKEANIPSDYFNLISNGFVAKGETDEQKLAEGREKYDAALAEKILSQEVKPELIVLAGWMHIFSSAFLDPMDKAGIRVINLHPSLPGDFDGANAIERAFVELEAGRLTRAGIMAHYVIQEVDRGEPIMVQEIPYEGEDLEAWNDKVHSYEHVLIVNATAQVVKEILSKR